MPYRRLPKTDAARLKALEALADNNEVYAVSGHFIDRKLISEAQRLYASFSDASTQYQLSMRTQVRYSKRIAALHHNAMTYLSHFLQVMFFAVERGEIKDGELCAYGLDSKQRVVPYLKTADAVMEWAPKIIRGEKERVRKGGKPILSPPIGAVATHFDVFKGMYDAQKQYQTRTQNALADITQMRPEVDRLILRIWDVIEEHYNEEPPEKRYDLCRKFGVVYYYRRNERK
ncbi:MAG: hypothetical protein J6Y97_08525 [Prevotella sp.]|nr:hypothetical protein [Prevotella sp.]